MFTYCFYLQPSLACSVNVHTEEAPFFFFEFGYFFTSEQTQNAGYEMAALTVVRH